MKEDERCCGSGACIINDNGECWCGQLWDGEKMSYPLLEQQKEIKNNLHPKILDNKHP